MDVDKGVEWGIRGSSPSSVAGRERREVKDRVRQLVDQAIRGDAEAFGALYDAFADAIYRYLLHNVSSAEDAEDLVSRTFLQAWRGIGGFRWRGRPFEAWLFRLARNQLIDFYRHRHVQGPQLPLDEAVFLSADTADSPEARALAGDRAAITRSALARLTFEQREVIVLKFFLEQDTREIAAITGKREGTVRAMQMRALQALRRYLSEA